jgi:hypothetical protein
MGILGGGDTVHRCFVTGPGLGATGHFIGDLFLRCSVELTQGRGMKRPTATA